MIVVFIGLGFKAAGWSGGYGISQVCGGKRSMVVQFWDGELGTRTQEGEYGDGANHQPHRLSLLLLEASSLRWSKLIGTAAVHTHNLSSVAARPRYVREPS